jgi:hypothetical protein
MKNFCTYLCWGLAMVAIICSPVAVILAVPLAIGLGLDIFDLGGETPIVFLLCAPLAIVLPPRLFRAAELLWTRLHHGHPAHLHYAP